MINEQNTRQPDYKGDGVAIWKKTDKNGKLFLSVKVLGCYLNAFKNEPRQEKVEVEQI
jgi:hypothetical protein